MILMHGKFVNHLTGWYLMLVPLWCAETQWWWWGGRQCLEVLTRKPQAQNGVTCAPMMPSLDLILDLVAVSTLPRNVILTSGIVTTKEVICMWALSIHAPDPRRGNMHDKSFDDPFPPKRRYPDLEITFFLLLITPLSHPSSYKSCFVHPLRALF